MKTKILAVLLSLLGLSSVASATTLNVTSGQSTAAIQGVLNSAVVGDTVSFAAGTYNITAGLTLKCGVTYTAATQATPSNVILSASFAEESTDIFTIYGGCTSATSISYLSSLHAGLIYVNTPSSNLTITHNQVGDLKCCRSDGFAPAINFSDPAGGTANLVTNDTVTWNQLGDSTSCTTPTNAMTNTGSPETNQGVCAGIIISTSVNGLDIEHNNFVHLGEGVHVLCYGNRCSPGDSGGSGPTTFGLVAQFNDFYQIHRIAWEEQPEEISGVVYAYNSEHDWFTPYYGSFGISMACCANPASFTPFLKVLSNVVTFNAAPSGRYGYGVEGFGTGLSGDPATYTNNMVQANYATGAGMVWGLNGNYVPSNFNYNYVCGSGFASGQYILNEFSSHNPPLPTATTTGSITTSTCSASASAAPTISPSGGSVSFPLVITLTDAGFNSTTALANGNTGIWYTTDGSSPVPGSGTAQRVDSGGTFILNGAATVKAVGMWGAANQPTSYASGYGFVPSSMVSATYTNGGAATLTSVTLSGIQVLAFPPATTSQLSATGFYSNSTNGPVTPTGWSSSAPSVATVSASGLVTAVSAGTTNITATLSGVTSPTYTITVSTPAITSGHLSTTPTDGINTLIVGNTQQFQPVATYANGATGNVTPSSCTWSIVNGTAMTISSSGLVTATSAGTSSVQTVCGGVTFNRWDVTVAATTLTSTSLNSTPTPGIATASVPNTVQLATTGTYSNGTSSPVSPSSYTSSTLSQCTVTNTGLVTAVAAGGCSITSTTGAIVSSTYPITISATTLTSISVTGAIGSMPTGTTQQLTATGTYSDGSSHNISPPTWVSLTTAQCSVDSSGNVTAIAVGTCNITAVQGSITSSSFNTNVVLPAPPTVFTDLAAMPVISAAIVGETVQLNALGVLPNGFFGNPTGVTWASNNTDVATVDANGLVTLVGIGTAQVTASLSTLSSSSVSIISLPSFANATNQYSPCCSLLYGLTVGSHTLVVHENGSVTIN